MQDNKADARFLSPWGIAHALAMLLEGAEPGSASYQQLQQVVYGLKDNSADASSLSTALKQLTDAIVEVRVKFTPHCFHVIFSAVGSKFCI